MQMQVYTQKSTFLSGFFTNAFLIELLYFRLSGNNNP